MRRIDRDSGTRRRFARLAAVAGLALTAAWAVSCKRTWNNCYDPINPPCGPTLEVVNCLNLPAPCNTPGNPPVSGCSYCSTTAISGCGGSPPPPHCENAICYRATGMNYGFTITHQRAYWPGTAPVPAWTTVLGGAVTVERGKTGPVINYTWCTASMTPVVGIPGQPVQVEIKGAFDNADVTPMNVSTVWRP